MSTRCTIHLNDVSNGMTTTIFRRQDGYPEVVGYEIKDIISRFSIWDGKVAYRTADEVANILLHDHQDDYQLVGKGGILTQMNAGTEDSEWIYDVDFTEASTEPILKIFANAANPNGFERGMMVPLSDFRDFTVIPDSRAQNFAITA